MKEIYSVKEFQKRRKRAFKLFLPCLTLMFGSLFAMIFGPRDVEIDWVVYGLAGFFVSIGAQLVVFLSIYRCPLCNTIPMLTEGSILTGSYEKGIDLAPKVCPTCGARLK